MIGATAHLPDCLVIVDLHSPGPSHRSLVASYAELAFVIAAPGKEGLAVERVIALITSSIRSTEHERELISAADVLDSLYLALAA